MPKVKRVLISMPQALLDEMDDYLPKLGVSRSEFIRNAVKSQIKAHCRLDMEKEMEKGYQEMAQINLSFAHMCYDADCEQLASYEEKLK